MNDGIVARRERSYERTAAKMEVLASKAEDYKLTKTEAAEYSKLSDLLEKKHELVIKALKSTGELAIRAASEKEFVSAW